MQEGTDTVTTASGKEIKMSAQKDITVRDDFALDERVEIYKTYLMFCMTGDVVQLPMGGTIVVERDEQEFARLSQLGDVLGLSPMDVYSVRPPPLLPGRALREQTRASHLRTAVLSRRNLGSAFKPNVGCCVPTCIHNRGTRHTLV